MEDLGHAATQGFQFCVQNQMRTIFQFHSHSWWFCTFHAECPDDRFPCSPCTTGSFHSAQSSGPAWFIDWGTFSKPKGSKGSAKAWARSAPEAVTVSLLFFHTDFPLPLVTWTLELIGLIFHCKSHKITKIENRTTQQLEMKILVVLIKIQSVYKYSILTYYCLCNQALSKYLTI